MKKKKQSTTGCEDLQIKKFTLMRGEGGLNQDRGDGIGQAKSDCIF